jgi:molybdopterin converting factor subunit 1
MKTVTVRYFAALRECAGKSMETRETPAETYTDLYNELNSDYNFPLDASRVRVAVGEAYAEMDQEIQDSCELAFIPPVAGG